MQPIGKGAHGGAVRSIQEMLRALGYLVKRNENGGPGKQAKTFVSLKADGLFGSDTQSAVMDFQSSEGLLRDGVVGPVTMKALEATYRERVLALSVPGDDDGEGRPDRLVFRHVKADRYGDGYERLSLRSDVATMYEEAYKDVQGKGAVLTSSGGIRSLRTHATRSRAAASFHYLGRAFDLFIFSGMVNPETDPYVIRRVEPRVYRVYARCEENHATADAVANVVTYRERKHGRTVAGSFFDLTELLERRGFRPIKARPHFESGSSIMGAEWWHFQCEKGLIPGVTTFGSELLEVYARATLEGTAPWQQRDRIFKIDWS